MTIRRILGAFLLMPGSFVALMMGLNALSTATGIGVMPLAAVSTVIGGVLLCLK